jgi:hypothetical protein
VEEVRGNTAGASGVPPDGARLRGEETTVPQYLIAFNDEWVPLHSPDELRAKSQASHAVLEDMKAAGVFVFADGGIDASTALCSVVCQDGQPVFTDGPYTETKEHLGGFTVIEAPDDDAARYWAGRIAVSLDWPQEVHRFPSGVTEIIDRQVPQNG